MTAREGSNTSSSEAPYEISHDLRPQKKYVFGMEGSTLRNQISIAGAIGFLLFGYDQGVLGVNQPSRIACSCDLTKLVGAECCR